MLGPPKDASDLQGEIKGDEIASSSVEEGMTKTLSCVPAPILGLILDLSLDFGTNGDSTPLALALSLGLGVTA